MQITIPAGTMGLPPALFDWIRDNDGAVAQVSGANPFHINDGSFAGTTVLGTPFELPIKKPMDDYLAAWLLERFGEHDSGTSVLDDMESMITDLGNARQAARDATELANELRDQILARLRTEGSSVGTVNGRPAVQLKVVESKRLDTARLRREQPDIADIYTSVSTSERLELL